jgi:hypothetical protein
MKTIISSEIQEAVSNTYRAIRQKAADIDVLTVLHMADEYSFIAQGRDTVKPEKLWVFDIGTEKTAGDFFKHNPPTPADVENAIQVVEDEVMPLHRLLISTSDLYTLDESVYEIAKLTAFTGSEQKIILSRPDMEQVFNRLAAIISGRPASQDILPTTNSFAATLLILREVMHHLGFMNITVLKR